jgi:IclR family KDG regulon transcriptional repressor
LLQAMDVGRIGKDVLQEIARLSGHTVNLVILDGKDGVYIDKVEGHKSIIRYSRVGRRVPLHCSAVGKVLAANLTDAKLRDILDKYKYAIHTDYTVRSEELFLEELALVRERGYAIDNEENEAGVYCMAYPVRNHLSEVVAAVSISLLKAQCVAEEKITYRELLKDSCLDLSKRLGYRSLEVKEKSEAR